MLTSCGHSLNLVGQSAVDCCTEAVDFFSIVQKIYTFYSGSTHKWSLLTSALTAASTNANKLSVVRRLSDTRWSAHADVISESLTNIASDSDEKPAIQGEVRGLCKSLFSLETAFMALFWNQLLQAVQKVSIKLQDSQLDLNTAVDVLRSLQANFEALDSQFDYLEEAAKALSGEDSYRAEEQ